MSQIQKFRKVLRSIGKFGKYHKVLKSIANNLKVFDKKTLLSSLANSITRWFDVIFAHCVSCVCVAVAEDGRSEASDGILPFEWERAGGEMLGSKK